MKNALLLLAILIASALPAAAQSAADGLDTTLVAYYRWCNRHKQDPEMLLKPTPCSGWPASGKIPACSRWRSA